MKLTRALRHYTTLFHILGQNSYPPFEEFSMRNQSRRRIHKSLNYLPTTVLLLLTTFLSAKRLNFIFGFESYTNSGSVIVLIGSLSYVAPIYVSISQSLLHSSEFVMLFAQINAIEQASRGKYSFDFHAFRRKYLRQLCIILAVNFLPSVLTIVIEPESRNISVMVIFLTLRTLTLLPVFHVLFYIDLIDHLLKSFTRYVDTQTTNALSEMDDSLRERRSKFVNSELNDYKLLHFKLWEAAQSINNIFGWMLNTILLQFIVSVLYNVYFTLGALGENFSSVVLRK